MRPRGLSAFILVVVACSPPGVAAAMEEYFSEIGWVAYAIDAPGHIYGRVQTRSGHPSAMGVHIMDEMGRELQGHFATGVGRGFEAYARVMSQEIAWSRPPADTSVWGGVGTQANDQSGVVFVVLWTAAPVAGIDWRVNLSSDDGPLRIVGRATGTSSIWGDGQEFPGPAAVGVRTPVAKVAGTVSGGLPVRVEHFLLGRFDTLVVPSVAAQSSIRGDVERDCPCVFVSATGTNSLPRGNYTMHWEGAQADPGEPLFAGADVRLPLPLR